MILWGLRIGKQPALASGLLIALALLMLSVTAGCGGAATAITGGAGQLASDNTNTGGSTLASGITLTSGALPSIPMDDTDSRGVSDVPPPPPDDPPQDETRVILGADFLAQWSGEVADTAISLDPALEQQDEAPIAFALYQVDGLSGRRPLELDVEGAIGGEGQEYYVGVADYTRARWQWFGPNTDALAKIDLRGEHQRYVSRAGNMYFIVVARDGSSVLLTQSTVTIGANMPGDHPGCPVRLEASDGTSADSIEVKWMAGEGSVSFELFRADAPAPGQQPQWTSLGTTTELSYTDSAVEAGKIYLYRVQATNDAGKSCTSNVDHGFAGEAPPPPPQFEIGGRAVQQGTEDGIPGVVVALLGAPHDPNQQGPDELIFTTAGNGEFGFKNLPPGQYIVVPQNPGLEFTPQFLAIGVDADHPHPMLRFEARPAEHTHAVWGFVYTMGGPDNPGLHPMANVPVAVKNIHDQNPPQQVQTGEMGFFMLGELANGDYDIRPLGPPDGSLQFFPGNRPAHIDGEHMTPGLFFRGQGPPPGDGGGGGGNPGQG
jgi:hypothetical protein